MSVYRFSRYTGAYSDGVDVRRLKYIYREGLWLSEVIEKRGLNLSWIAENDTHIEGLALRRSTEMSFLLGEGSGDNL